LVEEAGMVLDERVTRIESDVAQIRSDLTDVKADVRFLKADVQGLRTDFQSLRTDMAEKFAVVRAEAAEFKIEMAKELGSQRAESGKEFGSVRAEIAKEFGADRDRGLQGRCCEGIRLRANGNEGIDRVSQNRDRECEAVDARHRGERRAVDALVDRRARAEDYLSAAVANPVTLR
jgi:hypothetical protein